MPFPLCPMAWASIIFAALAVAGAQAATPTTGAPLSTEDIVNRLVRNNLERSDALGAFHGTRIYRLDYRGFPGARDAEMVVEVKYQSPATKEFTIRSATGSKILIDRVLKQLLESEKEALSPENQKRVALNNDNYIFTSAGQESTPAGGLYILSVEPRTKNKLLYRGLIWVDSKDFAVVRIEATPAKNPSFWIKETKIEHAYKKVGDFWLPASNRSISTTRLGGHAVLTIEYKDYEITSARAIGDATPAVAVR